MIRAGIIGLGKMGISHCSILGAHPEVELVAVCDSSSIVLEGFKKHSRFECFSDYKKMIDSMNLDCIVVASPTKYHAEMVAYSLSNGLHVFCEKPLALHANEGLALAEKAKRLNLVNQVGYHNRFIGTFNKAKGLIESQAIGELYHFIGESYGPVVLKEKGGTWRSDKGQGGGCLYDYASHTIDLINYVLAKPIAVSGTKLKRVFSNDVEDAVYSTLTLGNGLSGQLCVNWSDDTYRKMSTQISILGTKGKIIADATELKIYLKEENKDLNLPKGWSIRYITDFNDDISFYLRGEEYSTQIDHFIACVRDKNVYSRSTFESASNTDVVINLLLNDA